MKVEQVIKEQYEWKATDYCCKKMEKSLRYHDYINLTLNGELLIGDYARDNAIIDYCPFCGKKINYESLVDKELK